jgi:hypothetical protein
LYNAGSITGDPSKERFQHIAVQTGASGDEHDRHAARGFAASPSMGGIPSFHPVPSHAGQGVLPSHFRPTPPHSLQFPFIAICIYHRLKRTAKPTRS